MEREFLHFYCVGFVFLRDVDLSAMKIEESSSFYAVVHQENNRNRRTEPSNFYSLFSKSAVTGYRAAGRADALCHKPMPNPKWVYGTP